MFTYVIISKWTSECLTDLPKKNTFSQDSHWKKTHKNFIAIFQNEMSNYDCPPIVKFQCMYSIKTANTLEISWKESIIHSSA